MRRSYYDEVTIDPGASEEIYRLNTSGTVMQINMTVDGSSPDALDSYFRVTFDGASIVEYPTIRNIRASLGEERRIGGTSLADVTTYNNSRHTYGYYIRIDSLINSNALIEIVNGDSGPASFIFLCFYDS